MPRTTAHAVLWFTAAALALAATAQPDAVRVSGQVIRTSGGGPVPGANVVLVGTLYGTMTDDAGRFSLGVVRPGRYTLRVSIAGLAVAERALTVPDDVEEPLVIALRDARARLGGDPLMESAVLFGSVAAVPPYGDPLITESGDRTRRLAGVGRRRIGVAYSAPVVRGLSAGRTGTSYGLLSDALLEIPGVGTLDLASVVEPAGREIAVLDPVPGPVSGDRYVGLSHDSGTPSDAYLGRNTATADLGYQSNIDVFNARIATAGGSSRLRTVGIAGYSAGRDFASGSARTWDGSFRHGGVFVSADLLPTRRSVVSLTGRVATLGAADLPGSALELDRASHAGLRISWTATPEGERVRRSHVSVGWVQSGADLSAASPAGDWSSMDADQSQLDAVVALDLHSAALERMQAGVSATIRAYDWSGVRSPTPSSAAERTRVDADRVRLAPFITTNVGSEELNLSLVGRLDAIRTRIEASGPGAADQSSWRLLPAAGAALTYRPDRHWMLIVTAATLAPAPPLPSLSETAIPTPDRLPRVPVAGNADLEAERLYFAGARLTSTGSRQVIALAAFLMRVDRYVVPVLIDSGQYVYANGDATLAGFELSVDRELLPFVRASGHVAYARGHNRSADEPLPLVYPLNGRIDLTASAARGRLLLELSTEGALRQGRVASSLGEQSGDGYAAFHMWLAIPVTRHFGIRTGVYNIFDAAFAPHLNVFVDEYESRLAAPGRSWLVSGRFRF